MEAKQVILLRIRIVFLALCLVGLAVMAKLVYLQLVQGPHWKKVAQEVHIEARELKPARGNIYASDGSLLATSLTFYRVAMDPCVADEALFTTHLDRLSEHLADFYGDKTPAVYTTLIRTARQAKRRYLVLNPRHIDWQAKNTMSQWPLFRAGRWQGGVIFEKIEKRFHPFQGLAMRTLGFFNEASQGVGLEYSFNEALRGISGRALYQKMVGGHWKMLHNSLAQKPVDGYDIETTLDINLQDVAHSSLHKVLVASQAAYGCVVIMEVATGAIRAMVNLGQTPDGQYKEIYNYAIGSHGATEPGSSFKLIAMLALLEETDLALTDTVDTGRGYHAFHDRVMHDVKPGGHGVIPLQDVFEQSSNIGMAKLVDSVFQKNPQKFIDHIHRLGLHQPLGISLCGEGIPLVKNPADTDWNRITLPWMSMGYELKLTPLQLLAVYNAVANRGQMIKPMLVKKIKRANRTIRAFSSPVLHKRICSPQTLDKLQTMLAGVVERGTASKFKHGVYKIAGKSGTANKVEAGRYGSATYTSFVGYFPVQKPKYSCIVVIDDPKGMGYHYGAQTAAPVVKEIADKISVKDLTLAEDITVTHTPPSGVFPIIQAGHRDDLAYLCRALHIPHADMPTGPWVRSSRQASTLSWRPHPAYSAEQVPGVIGMMLRDALFLLENCGLSVTFVGDPGGRVQSQSVSPGARLPTDKAISLTLH